MEPDLLQSRDPHELGRRLQGARRARGLTQQQVGEQLAIARTTVTAIEKGERRVQPTELVAMAELYGRSVGALLRQGEPVEAFVVQLRATLPPETPVEREIAPETWAFQQLCEDYLQLERICQAPLPRRYPAQYEVGRVSPENAADDVAGAERNRMGVG
ncbi:MAG: helix-turn-helix domain-containing protein, partial [Dehalococcoidia bacterium]